MGSRSRAGGREGQRGVRVRHVWDHEFVNSHSVADIFDGFYIRDRDASGNDINEAELHAYISATASLDVFVAEAGVTGGIFADLFANFHDNNNDGKIRGSEIIANVAKGPQYLFDLSGELSANSSRS